MIQEYDNYLGPGSVLVCRNYSLIAFTFLSFFLTAYVRSLEVQHLWFLAINYMQEVLSETPLNDRILREANIIGRSKLKNVRVSHRVVSDAIN